MLSHSADRLRGAWLVTSSAAVLLAAGWLRSWDQPYLVAASAAIALTVVLGWRARHRVAWVVTVLALAVFAALAWRGAVEVARMEGGWDEFERVRSREAEQALDAALARDLTRLDAAARQALALPGDPRRRFRALEALLPDESAGEVSAVVSENGSPSAWMGKVRLRPDAMRATRGVAWGEFYVVAYAAAERGGRRALVMRTLHAVPPADRLAHSLAEVAASAIGIQRYDLRPDAAEGYTPFRVGADTIAWGRALTYGRGEAQLRVQERARVQGALALAVALLALLAAAWRRPAPPSRRFATLAVALATVYLVPLNALSNRSVVFDASYFYTPFGGNLTASVAALALTSALAVLAVFALRRARYRSPRAAAVVLVLAVASLGPFLLRDLARGISVPTRGIPATLWIAWDIALFLAAVALLLTGASAGRAALRGARGLPPLLAPLLAAAAAVAAPVLWQAPGRWPAWYPIAWIVAMGALALAQRSRAFVLHAALVAACGAATLVWGSVARARVALAERDISGLSTPDDETPRLLERFADDLRDAPAPRSRTELLRRYVSSDLASSGNPMELAVWRVGEARPDAELVIADFDRRPEGEREVVAEVAATGRAVIRELTARQGAQLVLGAPVDSGRVVTVVVSPRTRLIAEDPFASLLGLEASTPVEPPYRLAVATLGRDAAMATLPRWERTGDELHGDWRIGGPGGFVRAHVEVELRSIDALVQRGALLVLIDLLVLGALWTVAAAADGALWRWLRMRVRRWRASYRTRLTLAFFAAFVVPAAAFAAWTYQRLAAEDRTSRELLVRETLRAVAATSDLGQIREDGDRLDTPLFLYTGGALTRSSDEVYDALAPLGWFLDPVAAQDVTFGDEVAASRRVAVGGVATLVGYRVLMDTRDGRIVLAAPARRSELTLERQRRDLGVLVAFATALGALAALWLSGLAARAFARPIAALREAALTLGAGARTLPSLGAFTPYEFQPVFSAFRRMAADLGESRDALEGARRQTETVLRNVASGVVACDRTGRVTLANAQAERILGAPIAPGATLLDAGEPTLHARLLAFFDSGTGDDAFDIELRGRQLRARLTRLVRGEGGAVLTLDDVTELARAERVFAWGEMARQVAHEIKNPLTPIRLGVQHLRRAHADRRPDFDAILERNVARILAEIDRLDEIARAFSKFGTIPGERPPGEPTDVAAIARDVVALERMGESDVEWVLEGADDPLVAISRGDELREVLLNLLENARHANARRVVTTLSRDADGVAVTVTDDGDGIASDVLPRVFEPHFSTRTSGSGLGLAISKRLVESWGGAIQITAAAERGTIARLTLAPAAAT